MSELPVQEPAIPLPVVRAVKDLWEGGFRNETQAFGSASFQLLAQNCSAVCPTISGSRLAEAPASDFDRQELRDALHNFFRWTGAPWYSPRASPSPEDAAARLHAAFLLREVRRKYVVPLDRLGLSDAAKRFSGGELQRLTFGPCEVAVLDAAEFAAHVRAEALARFGDRYRLDSQDFAEFYYLVMTAEGEAGPIWKRGSDSIRAINLPVDSVGNPRLYEPVYAEVLGKAIFTMLLRFAKDPREAHEGPFAIPWVYSVTDDPFSHPEHNSITDDPFSHPEQVPDPSSLTRTPFGDPDEENWVPYRGEGLEFQKEQIETALQETWDGLEAALCARQLHPLAEHFFLKGFRDQGIDQIIANLSCIEATLMLKEKNGSEKMLRRYQNLVRDEDCLKWLKDGYKFRNKYLHSLGQPGDILSWEDLAKTRWAVAKALDAYLSFAVCHPAERRKTLLCLLNRPPV
jgi:hypothetical protein